MNFPAAGLTGLTRLSGSVEAGASRCMVWPSGMAQHEFQGQAGPETQ